MRVGEGRTAKLGQIEPDRAVLGGALRTGNVGCGLQFGPVPLAVVERQAVAIEACRVRDGECRCGIESAGEEYNGFLCQGVANIPLSGSERDGICLFLRYNPLFPSYSNNGDSTCA